MPASKVKKGQRARPAKASRAGRAARKPVKAKASPRSVYFFGSGRADGNASMRNLLGGKGANLAEMAGLGLPVPPGFTITTEVCTYFYEHKSTYPLGLRPEVERHLARIEQVMERRFGATNKPLLVSVRSGARASMPGMMDTVLNLGLNPETVDALARESGNPRFAYDCYRRFIQMFGDVVLGLKPQNKDEIDPFETLIEEKKKARGVAADIELSADDLRELAHEFKHLIRARLGIEFPDDPMEQLWRAIGAVFGSWNTPRAVTYRKLNHIPDDWGTAVNVQAMVFGNLGDDCATGVAFTRDPATGEHALYGEFLANAQGEDVVAGIRTPQQITLVNSRRAAASSGMTESQRKASSPSLEESQPQCSRQLLTIAQKLERHYRDMQDLEFTIERGRLWMLQTRNGKRTAAAAVKIAVDMVKERLIDRKAAILRVQPADLDQLMHPRIDPAAPRDLIAKGLAASPGAASGFVVFSADDATARAEAGDDVILVRIETSPEDIHGMHAARGVLTARGGATSHAAVVGRGMGKSCVVGCGALDIDYKAGLFRVDGRQVRSGDLITIDGGTGEVFAGRMATIDPTLSGDFGVLMGWADQVRRLGVRANADTPHDATIARELGAQGIGLCRTEHMFFDPERIDVMREMILANDTAGRERALAKLLPMQKGDFAGILRAMAGYPVTIRLLDPPLHEFLPATDKDLVELAERLGVGVDELRRRRDSLHEVNPMLGHRGCRLGITYPEIYAMQVRAIMEAACELWRERVKAEPEIMIPLVGDVRELAILRAETLAVIADVVKRYGLKKVKPPLVGTMIELPRAALTANEIATQAEFFSFGTNDLTQTTYGISRDDGAKFIPAYTARAIFPIDPFVSIDQRGVGELVRLGTERGRQVHAKLKVGICGEHGGDPASVVFCHQVGLDYVSCSPYRVPIARLAAAHAALGAAGGPSTTA